MTATHKTAEYISSLYPVRLRVFDGSGRQLKEGEATMPWGLLTNGLADMCRLSMSLAGREEGGEVLVVGSRHRFLLFFHTREPRSMRSDVCIRRRCSLWRLKKRASNGRRDNGDEESEEGFVERPDGHQA